MKNPMEGESIGNVDPNTGAKKISRRDFLKLGAAAAAVPLVRTIKNTPGQEGDASEYSWEYLMNPTDKVHVLFTRDDTEGGDLIGFAIGPEPFTILQKGSFKPAGELPSSRWICYLNHPKSNYIVVKGTIKEDVQFDWEMWDKLTILESKTFNTDRGNFFDVGLD